MKNVVITGAGVVSPIGTGWADWARGLREGRSGTQSIQLFEPCDPQGQPLACRVAAQVLDFDPAAHMAPGDLKRVPRAVPMALCAAREAVAAAGLDTENPDALSLDERRDWGVVIGSGGGGFSFAEAQFAHWYRGQDKGISPYAVSSSIAGMVSSEISIALGLRGRSHTISDGCTSSSDAFGYALDLIRAGRTKRLLCGGVDSPITPATIAAFCLMRAVPTHWNERPEVASRPFSGDRDGFVLGEGAWMFVLEEEEAARESGSRNLGARPRLRRDLRGVPPRRSLRPARGGARHEAGTRRCRRGSRRSRLRQPARHRHAAKRPAGNRGRQDRAGRRERARHADERHQVADRPPAGRSRSGRNRRCHRRNARRFVPPTINLQSQDDACDLDYVANTARDADVQTALCNCLGFGSKNAAVVLSR
jgi:3-oxoacyl-[acyl-carrier-protein] synthase II